MFTPNPQKLSAQNTLMAIINGLTKTFNLTQSPLGGSSYKLSGEGPNINVSINKDNLVSLSFSLNSLYQNAFQALVKQSSYDFANAGRAAKSDSDFDAFKRATQEKVKAYFGPSGDKVTAAVNIDYGINLTFNVSDIESDPVLAAYISEILQISDVKPRPDASLVVNF